MWLVSGGRIATVRTYVLVGYSYNQPVKHLTRDSRGYRLGNIGRWDSYLNRGKEIKMAEPTKKVQGIENLIDAFNPSGRKRVDSIKQDICSWCGKPATEFRDALSRKEYTISGFCQVCQDKTFG